MAAARDFFSIVCRVGEKGFGAALLLISPVFPTGFFPFWSPGDFS
jgi:hypothetical protein